MEQVKIEDARARLDELIDRAAAGETIVIERDGKRAAVSSPPAPEDVQSSRFDWDEHLKWLENEPMDPRSPEELDAELRSLDRY